MSDFEYRIAALCRDGKVSTGSNSSRDLKAVKKLRDQLASGADGLANDFRDVWVERGSTTWERI